MSGIRKYSRYKTVHSSQKKMTTKISLCEMLMIAGGAVLIADVLGGMFSYTTYTAGRSEQIHDSYISAECIFRKKLPVILDKSSMPIVAWLLLSLGVCCLWSRFQPTLSVDAGTELIMLRYRYELLRNVSEIRSRRL